MKKTKAIKLTHLITISITILILACTNKNSKEPTSNKPTSIDKIEQVNLRNILVGTWVSTSEFNNGEKVEGDGVHTLTFIVDGTFESVYKPSNLKKGGWSLIGDSIIRLQMKVLDDYLIKDISDSTLKTQLLYLEPDNYIIEYAKR